MAHDASEVPPESQPVLAPLTEAAIFIVMTTKPDAEDAVREVLADVSGLVRSVGFRIPEGTLSCVVGIGAKLWDGMFGAPRPAGLHPFPGFHGPRHTAPATDGDLLFHIRAHRLDMCFELATRIVGALDGAGTVVDEVHGFRSFDQRDLLGFVDGTENPSGQAAQAAVTVGSEDPDFTGGSYVIVQKYLHDLTAWNGLSVEQQERAIGRTKLEDIEIPDAEKAPNSHVALNTVTDAEGNARQIVRLNMPFGNAGQGEFGTYFIGYASTPEVTEEMLSNMFLGRGPATHDRVLDFSTAVTGCLFYVPTADFLDNPPGASTTAEATPADPHTPTTPADHSLGIGGLREDST